MTKQNINSVLKEVLKRVNPEEKELKIINDSLKKFIQKIEKRHRTDLFDSCSSKKSTFLDVS